MRNENTLSELVLLKNPKGGLERTWLSGVVLTLNSSIVLDVSSIEAALRRACRTSQCFYRGIISNDIFADECSR